MPRYYSYGAQPRKYNTAGRMMQPARAAETLGLGDALGPVPYSDLGAHNPRYVGPVPPSDLGPTAMGAHNPRYTGPSDIGPVLQGAGFGSLGKLGRKSFFGGQVLGDSMFGGQNKDLGAAMLSDNEKRLVMIGVIGLVGWFVFGDKIKKALKK